MNYKIKKDLSYYDNDLNSFKTFKAGTLLKKNANGSYILGDILFTQHSIITNPDWFEPIKDDFHIYRSFDCDWRRTIGFTIEQVKFK